MREWNGSSTFGSLGTAFSILSILFLAIAIVAGILYVFFLVMRNIKKKAGSGAQGSDKKTGKNKDDRIERGLDDR